MRDDTKRLLDVLEAIQNIERYTRHGKEKYLSDELVQAWILHHLMIIGEAVRSFSESFREQHDDLPWKKIIGMRNIITHQYFGIDREVVWNVVEKDMPVLKTAVEKILGTKNQR